MSRKRAAMTCGPAARGTTFSLRLSGKALPNVVRLSKTTARFYFKVSMVGKAIEPAPTEPGDGQTWFPGQALPKLLRVIVVDGQTREPQSGSSVTFSTVTTPAGGSGASLSVASATTGFDGLATTSLTLDNTTGTYKVRADCATCANGSFTFNALALSTPIATSLLEEFCGGNQFVSQALPGPLVVRASNTVTGRPVPGFTVNFTTVSHPSGSPGSLNPASTSTDGQGAARSSFTVGSATGTYVVQAVCPDCLANATVTCALQGILPPDLQPPPEPVVQVVQRRGDFSVVAVPPEVAPMIPLNQSTAPYPIQATMFVSGASTGAAVAAAVSAQDGSGGHNHVPPPPRPVGSLHEVPASIGASGIGTFVYISSMVAGLEYVDVELTDAQGAKTGGNAGIPVRIPGFVPLPLNTTYYRVRQTDQGTQRHPINYYGRPELIQELQKLAELFRSSATGVVQPSSIAFSTGTLLSFNDLSLSSGGIFDIDGDWLPTHDCHRRGTSVDINRSVEVSTPPHRIVNAENLGALLDPFLISTATVNCRRVIEEHVDCDMEANTVTTKCPVHLECPAEEWERCRPRSGISQCVYKVESFNPLQVPIQCR